MTNIKGQSTILIERKVIELLKKVKAHPRETYNETIEGLAMEKLAENRKTLTAGMMFGSFPRKPKNSAQKIKDEMRKGWE